MPSIAPIQNWYYLDNFEIVLRWVAARYHDLLERSEQEFIHQFFQAPQASRGLLVRMIMRKGELFRVSKLHYAEIGPADTAATHLAERGWLNQAPLISLDQMFALFTKAELASLLAPGLASVQADRATKAALLNMLRERYPTPLPLLTWTEPLRAPCKPAPDASAAPVRKACRLPETLLNDQVYELNIGSLCDRFRLMFFGNLQQDWTEFVLSHLGLFNYERVEFPDSARAFQTRAEIDDYLHLHQCKQQYAEAAGPAELADILNAIPAHPYPNDWIERRRAKLLFQIGRQFERLEEGQAALACYERSTHAGARLRRIRVLERATQFEAARALAASVLQAPISEAECQAAWRMMPRLQRLCGARAIPRAKAAAISRIDLTLPVPPAFSRVEEEVRHHLAQPDAPVFYVENTLINSLFGLLCWDIIFAAVPGAFFHPFQQGPADLLLSSFHERRRDLFEARFAQLASNEYKQTIRGNFACKTGIMSPFVAWGAITTNLLDLALDCIPAAHLKASFHRLLQDVHANRSGLPDLVQFWPSESNYRLIEVKGPGDRLQDNQVRWLDYCAAHGMPATVCYVQREVAA